ncbi:MAG: biopolymer transporter ExbD [Labilithrix sp.]|nr:biopolymer transporter ExbD [Labilithrix sp.]MCW5815333.1 biopolymer transporter ExbD [Labilithrix sp.]
MAGTAAGRRGPIVGINVTPMVDVVLVLLVIMMVSATYIVAQSLKVELPKTASSDEAAPQTAAVTLTKDGKTLYNEEEIAEPALIEKLRAAHGANADLSLVVSADQEVHHGAVVHVIDIAKVEGISKFAIHVERSK